jgi:3-deoxy-D-manno-octulosonic-acid transferase
MNMPLGLIVWRLLTGALSPVARLLLRRRAAHGKEDWARLNERLGISGKARPEGRLIWVHGASVGESLSALPLIAKLLENAHVLVTSGTVTSAAMVSQRLPQGLAKNALHQFVPLDTPGAVAGFLDHWRPDAGLLVESDLWPNLILAAKARGIKLALVNARISGRSAERWSWAKKSVARLLSAFDMVLAQDDEGAARFRKLGARNVQVVGSLKADAPVLPVDEDALAQLRQAVGSRPILLAAQTHPGEDETILPAHDLLRARFPDLLTILVPRHTARGTDLEMLCGMRAFKRRAAGEQISSQTAVYIADTMGEMGLFYRLAPFCFLGGTLVPLGGHNVLEPAALHCAVLAGPHTGSAPRAYDAVLQAQGFGRVSSSSDIAREAERLLADPMLARAAGDAAARGGAMLAGAVERTESALRTILDARA